MNSNDCIFTSSKYYRNAHAVAQNIAKPLGYDFLSQKQMNQVKLQKGSLVKKILFDKPLIKQLSNKRTLKNKILQHLLGQDRKKFTYLSAHPMSIITRTNPQINYELSQIYAPSLSLSSKLLIDFASTINSINKQSLFNINDYSLSKYFVYYDGDNIRNLIHILNIFDKEFLQYQIIGITSRKFQHQEQTRPYYKKWENIIKNVQFDHFNINNKQKIDQQILQIKIKSKQLDLMNAGVHFFIGDKIATIKNYDIIKQQIQNLQYLHYYLYLLCNNVLGQGQNAIINLRGTIRNKTTDLLYIYKLIFNKISLIKPAYSNFLSSQKYLICQGFILQNASQLLPFLNDNFNLLKRYGQQRLLINPQMIFRQQFQGDSTKNFNDSLITRGLKEVLDIYLKNSNLQIYPPKALLIQKINSFQDTELFDTIIQQIQKVIPSEQQIKNQQIQSKQGTLNSNNNNFTNSHSYKKTQTQQKQAGLDIFAFMKLKNQSQPAPQPEKSTIKPKIDEEDQIQKKMNQKYQQQQRIRNQKKKQKKQQQKKQKKQKQQEPYNKYNTHFQYSQY